jgi:MoxR-like ATPase
MAVSRPSGQTAEPSPAFANAFNAVVANVSRVIQGKTEAIQLALLCLLAEGHLLIEDVPGVGKTSMAKALAASIRCTFGRVQFTPDLLPSDVVGVSVFNRASSTFEFRPGPIFANFLLADEINRASPKTQSALLEAMAERQVTVDGGTYPLELPFMVIATENPIEHEGTYPLPEAQVDRFMARVSLGYPSPHAEVHMLAAHEGGDRVESLQPVATAADLLTAQDAAIRVRVTDALRAYVVALLQHTRDDARVELGGSPRAGLMLLRAAKAHALLAGRDHALPDDVQALAQPVLAHRIVLAPEAMEETGERVVADALAAVPAL